MNSLRNLLNSLAFRSAFLALVFVACTYIFHIVPPTLRALSETPVSIIQGVRENPYRNGLQPFTGQNILPSTVQNALALLRSERIMTFRCSHQLCDPPDIGQRMVESAYPIQANELSKNRIWLAAEPTPPGCQIRRTQENVVLGICP